MLKRKNKIVVSNERDTLLRLYLSIWGERPHYSEISGKYLGKEPRTVYFDHLLEKSRYPKAMYEAWNIVLVTFEEHELKTNGYPLPKHKRLIEEAKLIYNEKFKTK